MIITVKVFSLTIDTLSDKIDISMPIKIVTLKVRNMRQTQL